MPGALVNAESGGFLSMVRASPLPICTSTARSGDCGEPGDCHCRAAVVFTLNVRQYPKNENAVITITTAYVGADAKLVRGFITTLIERAIAAADGIDTVESTSAQGCRPFGQAKLNYDGKTALAEISTKSIRCAGNLPPERRCRFWRLRRRMRVSPRPI